jgi:hypothetical protein
MAGSTNEQRILATLRDHPGLNDDDLSVAARVRPRQQVNQICRRLESRGLLRRQIGPRGKIVNFLQDLSESERAGEAGRNVTALRSPEASRNITALRSPLAHHVRHLQQERTAPLSFQCDPGATLFIFPCSSAKDERQRLRIHGPSILDQVPPALSERLAEARRHIRSRAHVDEASLIPAWQRYTGSLYQAGRDAIQAALEAGVHMIILSGGYGLVLAAEPIGYYEAVFKNSWWPDRLLEEVLIEYLRRHRLRSLCAVASATTEYARLLRRVNWHAAGLESAVLLTPEETTGALVKSPRAQGESLSALFHGEIDMNWVSSDKLHLTCTNLI